MLSGPGQRGPNVGARASGRHPRRPGLERPLTSSPPPLRRTPLHDLHQELGGAHGALRRLGACRCTTRPASSPSIATAARPRRCSTSRIWARCGSGRPAPPRRSNGWCRATSIGLAGAACATPCLPTTPGGILDDLIVGQCRRSACSWWSMPRAATPTSPICEARSSPAARSTELSRPRAAGAAGPGGRRGHGAAGAAARTSCAFMQTRAR